MRITFDYQIATSLSPNRLWELLAEAFRDSDQSPLWPRHLERMRSAEVRIGAPVQSTYLMLGGRQSTVHYRLADVQPGRLLRYATEPGHPLRGGGTVEVIPNDSGSRLRWQGAYTVSLAPRSLAAASFTKLVFVPRFFSALESSLRAIERRER
jgi:uncharacterized protein YndB with AHSA1/START domain